MPKLAAVAAGTRDWLVTLVPQTQSTGASSFPVETDSTPTIALYAHRQEVSAEERFRLDQLAAPYTTRWSVPYREDIDPDLIKVPKVFLLECNGRRHDIVEASMIGRRAGVELLTLARRG